MRYEVADDEWTAIKPICRTSRWRSSGERPSCPQCIFWVLRTGAPWRDVRTPPATTASFASGGLAFGPHHRRACRCP
ncbi:hypothetical protein XH92_14985 [Bradyrhizobium sp. CCBAU 53421]|nr:hypothetical protein XH92_14985 [Bradyrhizobium sp. CCBAU 53421]